MPNSEKKHNLPKLPAEQIRKYKQAGQWPPPEGIIIMPEIQPSEEGVDSLFDNLEKILPPEKRDIVKKAKGK